MLYCYGEIVFEENKTQKIEKSSNIERIGKSWMKKFPFPKRKTPDRKKFKPETSPKNITDKFQLIEVRNISSIKSYNNRYLVLTTEGELYYIKQVRKNSQFKEKPIFSNVKSISCGKGFFCILTKDGSVFSCGDGSFGKLGHGSIKNLKKPKEIIIFKGLNDKIKHTSCGRNHTAVITEEGNIYTFGRGKEGQLGILANLLRNSENIFRIIENKSAYFLQQSAPKKLKCVNKSNLKFEKISCGGNFTSALTKGPKRSIYMCGENFCGQLAQNDTRKILEPREAKFEERTDKFITKNDCTCDLVPDNDDPDKIKVEIKLEVKKEKIPQKEINIREISAGNNHFLCLSECNTLFSCGLNHAGQLGHSNKTGSKILKRVKMSKSLKNSKIIFIKAIASCCVVLTENNDMYVFGKFFSHEYKVPTKIKFFQEKKQKIEKIFCCEKNIFVKVK